MVNPRFGVGRGKRVSVCNSVILFASSGLGQNSALPAYPGLVTGADHGNLKQRNHISYLYDSLRPSLFAYLSCLGLTSEEAEDLVQESFLRLVRHLLGWLFRVAHNLCMDTFRASRKYLDTGSEEEGPVESVDPALNPEEIAIKQEALVRLRTAMTRLTPQQRYAVFMRAEGLRYREIAAVLNISTQRVAELVQRALTRLAGDL